MNYYSVRGSIYGKTMTFDIPYGATPLDPDEADGLIPAHITLQKQLNEWEAANILEAEQRLQRRLPTATQLLTSKYLLSLHRWMFANTWRWAGELRRSNKNIGVEWSLIYNQLEQLLGDVNFQLTHETYALDEIAARFHHRLVAIHLFSNGNGRHARLSADILLQAQDAKRFSWGRENLSTANENRMQYIQALRAADKQDYTALLAFVRS